MCSLFQGIVAYRNWVGRRASAAPPRFSPSDVLFCDDLTGKGHATRAMTDMTAAFINRATS